MLIDSGRRRGIYGGGRRGLGDESITVTDTAVPVEYMPVDIQTAPILTYSGDGGGSSLNLSNYFDWIGGASTPAQPVFFPSSPSASGAQTANALTNLAAQVASIFRPTAAAPAAGSSATAAGQHPAAAAGAGNWLQQNMGLVVGGGVALVLLLSLSKRGR